MKKILIFHLLIIQTACSLQNPNNIGNCFDTITQTEITSKDEFVSCVKLLSTDSNNSDLTYSSLSLFWNQNLSNLIDRVEMLSYIPPEFEYYDFKNKPSKLHRLRAIKEILESQLKNNKIEGNKLIESIENSKNDKFFSFVLHKSFNSSNFTMDFQDYLYQYSIEENHAMPNYQKIQNEIFNLLIRKNPDKYLNKILTYNLINHTDDIADKILKYCGVNNIDIISDQTKESLISEMAKKINNQYSTVKTEDNVLFALDRLLSNKNNLSLRFETMKELLRLNRKEAYEKLKIELINRSE